MRFIALFLKAIIDSTAFIFLQLWICIFIKNINLDCFKSVAGTTKTIF